MSEVFVYLRAALNCIFFYSTLFSIINTKYCWFLSFHKRSQISVVDSRFASWIINEKICSILVHVKSIKDKNILYPTCIFKKLSGKLPAGSCFPMGNILYLCLCTDACAYGCQGCVDGEETWNRLFAFKSKVTFALLKPVVMLVQPA